MGTTQDTSKKPAIGSGGAVGNRTAPNPSVKPPAYTVYKKGFSGLRIRRSSNVKKG